MYYWRKLHSRIVCCWYRWSELATVPFRWLCNVLYYANFLSWPHWIVIYTGGFIMFSMITNIYNKKTKWPTLMELLELFTATGKLKKVFFFFLPRCVHHGWHGTHRYDMKVLAKHASTWVHRYSSLLQWSVPLGQRGHMAMVGWIFCTKCMLHSNHRLTHVIFQHTKRLLPQSGHFITTYTHIA